MITKHVEDGRCQNDFTYTCAEIDDCDALAATCHCGAFAACGTTNVCRLPMEINRAWLDKAVVLVCERQVPEVSEVGGPRAECSGFTALEDQPFVVGIGGSLLERLQRFHIHEARALQKRLEFLLLVGPEHKFLHFGLHQMAVDHQLIAVQAVADALGRSVLTE